MTPDERLRRILARVERLATRAPRLVITVLNKGAHSLTPVGGVPLELRAATRLRLTRKGLAPVEVTITNGEGQRRDKQLFFRGQIDLVAPLFKGASKVAPVELTVEVID